MTKIPQQAQDDFVNEMTAYYDQWLESREMYRRLLRTGSDLFSKIQFEKYLENIESQIKRIEDPETGLPNVIKHHENMVNEGRLVPVKDRFKESGAGIRDGVL